MSTKARILVVDDDATMREALSDPLGAQGCGVVAVDNASHALAELEKQEADLVLADLTLPRVSGLELLDSVRRQWPGIEVIVITGQGSIETAVDAIKRGAYHSVANPFTPDERLHLVGQALERRRLVHRKERLEEELSLVRGVHQLVGHSEPMRRIHEIIQTAAGSDATVLIQGESGTGKEIIANAIHAQSRRSRGPLVKMNCAAVPETLLESELFGHEKGAFTGADRRRIGRFEQADGGTLFLDEVCEMHPRLQAKFLRGLQEREIERLGGSGTIPVDVRIIAATNRDLQKALEEGVLREDLYYRLNVILLRVPALRERMDDVQMLAMHFLRKYAAREHSSMSVISDQAKELLISYSWPGNVRELENAIERAVVLGKGEQLQAQDLPPQLHRRGDDERPLIPAHLTLEEIEKLAIAQALRLTGGNKSEAAERPRRLLATHHRDARVRPGEEEPRAVGTAAHRVVPRAVGCADDDGQLRHLRRCHGVHHLGTVLRDAPVLVLLADHEAGDVLEEEERHAALAGERDEVRALQRGLREEHAVVGEDADLVAVQAGEAGDQRRAVERLELVEAAAVDQTRNHLPNLVRPARIPRPDAVRVGGGLRGRLDGAP